MNLLKGSEYLGNIPPGIFSNLSLLVKKKMKKKMKYMFTFPLSTIQGETIGGYRT